MLNKNIRNAALAASLVLFTTGSAIAQDATTPAAPATVTEVETEDNGFDLGWLGLLGLLGLAGLSGRRRDVARTTTVHTTGTTGTTGTGTGTTRL